ncbi:MAG: hypothetical protein IT577_08620 [Verrucomicrobiae bacterium]|nr:hypothetical protein [Verrucomicrobiae bacterium]
MAEGSNRRLSTSDAFNVTTPKGVATLSGQLSGEVVIGPVHTGVGPQDFLK